jgi:hypothetical protein
LHFWQEATTFFHVVLPPFDLGIMWSKVISPFEPQYWHLNSSRKNKLNRVKALALLGRIYCFKTTTEGIFISTEGDLTTSSYSARILTLFEILALIESCHVHNDNGKYESGLKSAFSTKAELFWRKSPSAKNTSKETSVILTP